MGRRVQVHAPTAIALDTERGEGRSQRGCIVQTVEDTVVLRNGENSLCVVNAKSFCAGSLDVMHAVELPQNVTFSRKSRGKYGVAWDTMQEGGTALSRAVYIVDYQTGEVTTRTVPTLDEEIADVFADPNGEQIVVVGTTTRNLHGWSRYDCDYNDNIGRWCVAEWRLVKTSVLDSIPVDACGWFVSSAVMGNCFAYLRARRHSTGSVIVEKWIFDVDAHWVPVSFSSRTLETSTSDRAEELALFMTENWQFAIMSTGCTLYFFQVNHDLKNSSLKRLSLDQKVLDGAWINQNAAFAVLLANGQISIASVNDKGCFNLLSIMTSNTMSKRLSLSALLGKAVSVARQVVWVAHEEQVIVDFESSYAAFKLSIIDNKSSLSTANHSNKSAELSRVSAFARYNRRVITSFHKKNFDDTICELLDRKSSPSPSKLIGIARIALTRSQTVFEDVYFLLLRTIHQQLAGDSVNEGNSRDPIDCIGKSLKLMELLVSFTISMEGAILRQISSRILSAVSGGAIKTDRNVYFRKEITTITQLLQRLQCGVSESDDWWIYSREMEVFLRVYFTPMYALLQKLFTKLKPEEVSQIGVLCQRIIEQDGSAVVESASNSENVNDSLFDQLTGLLASYACICCVLHVNGVMIDLEHYFSLVTPIISTRQEMLCCFIKPWVNIRVGDKLRPAIAESPMIQAVRFAIKSNTLQLLLNFSIASGSCIVHSCIQALCNATEICSRKTEVIASVGVLQLDNLHWLACESYIGEALGILHRLGPRRRFKYSNREAEYSTDCLSLAVRSNFDYYIRNLSAEQEKMTENCQVAANTSSLWKCSQLDGLLSARVVCLLSRIIWHLEAGTNNCVGLAQRAFVMHLFDSQLSREDEILHDCITKVRAIINPNDTELRLPGFSLQEDDQLSLPSRPKRIIRSLVLIAWIMWLREKTAICSRSAHIGKTTDNSESIGALFATCALHLNALGTICGDSEELLSIQLELLEVASTMNPHQTAAVISWGFSVRNIPTRHLKRYYGLRQALKRLTIGVSLEDDEYQYLQLQNHIRHEFHLIEGTLLNEELNHNDNRDIDVLAGCCCDPEFLQIISVLTKCPYEVVTVTHSAPPHETKTFVQEFPENSQGNVETELVTRADPELTALSTSEQHMETRKAESLISRDEVIALLQEQTRHLEEKIHAVKAAEQTRSSSLHEGERSVQTEDTPPFSDLSETKATLEILPGKVDVTREAIVNLPDVQRMARISLQVRDLGRHRYSSADKQNDPLSKPAQRHDSVRNALKLFRLRQENGGHARSEQVDLTTANENGDPEERVNTESNSKEFSDSQYPPDLSSRSNAVKRSDVNKKTSSKLRRSKLDGVPLKEPVHPLRLEYGSDNVSLKLLGRNSGQRNPSVKRRQFVHHERERQLKASTEHPKAISTSFEPTEEILLKTVSAQTNDSVENIPPASATEDLKELLNKQSDIGPEKESPVMQERDGDKQIARNAVNTHHSQKGVGIQCQVTNDSPANGAREKRGQIPLSIADKYPVWIDLDSANNMGARSHFKERKKFLQVARFGDFDTTNRTTNNDSTEESAVVAISPIASSVRERNVDDEDDENQCDDQHSPKISHSQSQEGHTTEQESESIKDRYRTIYREKYPIPERLSSRKSDDRVAAGGITSLIDLRANMQRMTQRLRVLETCANSIDEEFRVSQKRLTQIGDVRPYCASSQSRALEDIDEVLGMTEEADNETTARSPREGLLAKKASHDLNAAKRLLETIEQLTISTDD